MSGKVLLRICSTSDGVYCCLDMMIDWSTHSRTQERTRERSYWTSDAEESDTHTHTLSTLSTD